MVLKRKLWRAILSMIYQSYEISEYFFRIFAKDLFFIAPLPYAFGNLSEEIKLGLLASEIEDKKLLILLPPGGIFSKIFAYSHCNPSLREACVHFSRESIGTIRYNMLYAIYLTIFIAFRGAYLLLQKTRKYDSDLAKELTMEFSYYLSFPRIGIHNTWKIISISNAGEINIQNLELRLDKFIEILRSKIKSHLNSQKCKRISLPKSDIVVCHVRTNYYYKDGDRRNRNANIDDYVEGMLRIVDESSYSIVIIGDLNSIDNQIHPKIINIPNLGLDTTTQRAIEALAIMNSSLFIGTQSGPWDFAMLIGVNCITLNSIDLSTSKSTLWSENILITKPLDATRYESFWDDYDCDLNNASNSFNIFKYSSLQKTTTNILNSIAISLCQHPKIQNRNIKSYYLEPESDLMKTIRESLITSKNLRIIGNINISLIYKNLLERWEANALSNQPKYYTDYYSDEIMRLEGKNKLSNEIKSYAFLDVT